MRWANFLHIYQPPTQKREILERVVRECYRPVLSGLLKIPKVKLTLNFSSCLTELLVNNGFEEVINLARNLAKEGKLEFTASAKYHPLLPKIPEREIIRQIKMDLETNKKFFGETYNPQGFFPPEMAFNLDLAKIVAGLGLKWIIVDEFSYPGKLSWEKVYKIKDLPLNIYFRERRVSFKILSAQLGTEKMVVQELGKELLKNRYLLTAMDGETFGHHRVGLEELLFELYRSEKIESVFVSDLPSYFPSEEVVPLPSTWALMPKDIQKNLPFSRWDDPDNLIHQLQWRLTNLAISSVGKEEGPARKLLDRALHSDQYWWASARPWWSIEYIEAGAKELLEVVNLSPSATLSQKQEARDLYFKIITTAFDWQRSGKIREISQKEDEEVRQRTDQALSGAQKEEIKKMILSLKKQMLAAAKHQEYERAAQLRDRIKELKNYLK